MMQARARETTTIMQRAATALSFPAASARKSAVVIRRAATIRWTAGATVVTVPKAVRVCLTAALILGAGAVNADIYRYYDENGVLHLTDTPPDSRYKLYIATQKAPSAIQTTFEARRYRQIPAKRRSNYVDVVATVAKTFAIEPELLHAVISAESAYNPLARSPKGARGLMQLMPDTAKRYGVEDSYDPLQNIQGGAAYLRDLLTLFGNDLQLAVAAYNAGEGMVMRHGYKIPPFRETLQYVPKVMSYYRQYKGTL